MCYYKCYTCYTSVFEALQLHLIFILGQLSLFFFFNIWFTIVYLVQILLYCVHDLLGANILLRAHTNETNIYSRY